MAEKPHLLRHTAFNNYFHQTASTLCFFSLNWSFQHHCSILERRAVNKKSMIVKKVDHLQVDDNGEYGNYVQRHNLTTIGCVGGDVCDLQKSN